MKVKVSLTYVVTVEAQDGQEIRDVMDGLDASFTTTLDGNEVVSSTLDSAELINIRPN